MLVIAAVMILLGLFVAGLGWLLWVGIGFGLVGLILNLAPRGENPKRWRYY